MSLIGNKKIDLIQPFIDRLGVFSGKVAHSPDEKLKHGQERYKIGRLMFEAIMDEIRTYNEKDPAFRAFLGGLPKRFEIVKRTQCNTNTPDQIIKGLKSIFGFLNCFEKDKTVSDIWAHVKHNFGIKTISVEGKSVYITADEAKTREIVNALFNYEKYKALKYGS